MAQVFLTHHSCGEAGHSLTTPVLRNSNKSLKLLSKIYFYLFTHVHLFLCHLFLFSSLVFTLFFGEYKSSSLVALLMVANATLIPAGGTRSHQHHQSVCSPLKIPHLVYPGTTHFFRALSHRLSLSTGRQ